MSYLKVQGHPNFFRDNTTNAVLNVNMSEYKRYLNVKSAKENEAEKMDQIENEITSLKDDISEIKKLLIKLTNESR